MKQIKKLLSIFIFVLIIRTLALCSDDNGSTDFQFLKLDISARSLALGGAYGAVADDAMGMRYNPAGLKLLLRPKIGVSHMEWIEDFRIDQIAYGKPVGVSHAIGYNLFYMSLKEDVIGRDDAGFATGELKYEQSYFSVGWATRLDRYDNYLFGVNAKYAREILDYSESSVLALDTGLLLRVYRNVKMGLVVRNIGINSSNLPLETRVGLSFERRKAGLSLDAYKFSDTDLRYAIGYEYFIKNYFVLRTGYNSSLSSLGDLVEYESMSDVSKHSIAGLSFGFGFLTSPISFLGYREISFDYAIVDYGRLGFTHIFSMSIEL